MVKESASTPKTFVTKTTHTSPTHMGDELVEVEENVYIRQASKESKNKQIKTCWRYGGRFIIGLLKSIIKQSKGKHDMQKILEKLDREVEYASETLTACLPPSSLSIKDMDTFLPDFGRTYKITSFSAEMDDDGDSIADNNQSGSALRFSGTKGRPKMVKTTATRARKPAVTNARAIASAMGNSYPAATASSSSSSSPPPLPSYSYNATSAQMLSEIDPTLERKALSSLTELATLFSQQESLKDATRTDEA